jgi:hypothetical protein
MPIFFNLKLIIMKKYLLSLVLIVNCCVYSQTISNLIGTWHNELGSTLKNTSVTPNYQLVGSYTLNTGQTFTILG